MDPQIHDAIRKISGDMVKLKKDFTEDLDKLQKDIDDLLSISGQVKTGEES